MIEDKKLGLKVAESKTEGFWAELKKRMENDIEASEHNIEISKHILKLADDKLAKLPKLPKHIPAGVV